MLKDLTRADWLELLGIPEDRVPPVLVLRGTRNLRKSYDVYAELFTDILEVGSPNGLFEDVFIGCRGNMSVGYASVYGDSMASEITHVFSVLGTRLIIQTGCCGALPKGVQTGDLIIPHAAIPGEGAAQYYLPGADKIRVSSDIHRQAAASVRSCWPYHTGILYTTSALLAEGETELKAWEAAGHIGVDMETATTFAVAESFDVDHVAVLFVFDNPLHSDTLADSDEERAERRRHGETAMFEVLTRLLDSVAEDGID